MIDEERSRALDARIRQVCNDQSRYRVLFVFGPPRAGKSRLVSELCERNGWFYLNYTSDHDGLEQIRGREEVYSPEDFLDSMRVICERAAAHKVVVIDEIEPL